jgi:glycerol-3-phosphate acyltransferase PlsY
LSFFSALGAVVVAIAMISLTRFASMGTFGGAVTGLVFLVIFGWLGQIPAAYIVFGVLVVGLIGWALRRNFVSIQAGTERKIGASRSEGENQSEGG